jgi:hypothetical protein
MYEVLKRGRLHNLSIKCQLELFDSMVKPIILYGCETWGFGNNEIIERNIFVIPSYAPLQYYTVSIQIFLVL